MNTDSAFTIGDSHLVCEDYAISGGDYAIVCDGCSSSEMTDVGARILALTSVDVLSELKRFDHNIALDRITESLKLKRGLLYNNFPHAMFDSTLLFAKEFGEYIHVLVVGDGMLVRKQKNQSIIVKNYEYSENYPYYLSYELDELRKAQWNGVKQEVFNILSEICEDNTIEYHGKFINVKNSYNYLCLEKNDYEWIALFSDGINSFTDMDKNHIPLENVILELTKFKTFTGQFVQRRMNKFKKDCKKFRWSHYDDLSMAVINIGENNE